MKKIFFAAAIIVLFAGAAFAQESDKGLDPNKLFYAANGLYEKRDYTKALDEYNKILGMGIDSGNLYYNMANTYFKLGKLGYAVLFYEKAKRVMPHDSDLKANLDYARSLTTTSAMEVPRKNPVVTFVKTLFKNFSLNAIALSALMTYLVLMALFAVGIMNPVFAKKARIAYVAIAVIFL